MVKYIFMQVKSDYALHTDTRNSVQADFNGNVFTYTENTV